MCSRCHLGSSRAFRASSQSAPAAQSRIAHRLSSRIVSAAGRTMPPPGRGTARPRGNWSKNHQRGLNHGLKWATTAVQQAESAVASAHPQGRRTLVEEFKRAVENKSWQEYKNMRFQAWGDVLSGRAPTDLDEAASYAVHSSEFGASGAAAAAPPRAAPAASARD